MSKITFAEDAWEEYLYWQSMVSSPDQDKQTLKRINALLKAIQREPFTGEGKPEPLRGSMSGKRSRRINAKDRLVYEIQNDSITILQCRGHYDDK